MKQVVRKSLCSTAAICLRQRSALFITKTLPNHTKTTHSQRFNTLKAIRKYNSSAFVQKNYSKLHQEKHAKCVYTYRCYSSTAVASSVSQQASSMNEGQPDVTGYKPSVDYPKDEYLLPHPIWRNEYIDAVKITHVPPTRFVDRLAFWSVKAMRSTFDYLTGYTSRKHLDAEILLTRMIFLETVAGIPGSVAGILRHLTSLRRMKRDHGWIHTLYEEAENERMHLLTFIKMKRPGLFMRSMVWLTQGIFFNFYFLAYMVSPRYCHRFVGYLEEEAVKTYTHSLECIDNGDVEEWKTMRAPEIARKYWKMADNATVRDLLAVVRADEAHHREVNHTLGQRSDQPEAKNPFPPGY